MLRGAGICTYSYTNFCASYVGKYSCTMEHMGVDYPLAISDSNGQYTF